LSVNFNSVGNFDFHIVFRLALRRATEKNLNHHSRFCNHKIVNSRIIFAVARIP
jgi:hypothetical protein